MNWNALHTAYSPHARAQSLLISCPKLFNISAPARCPRTLPERCHNKFQLVYTYFYKHLKIITQTFSLCCEAEQSRPEQSRARPGTRCPDSNRVPPVDLKLNVQHMNYVSCLIKWFHLHARAPHACAAGSQPVSQLASRAVPLVPMDPPLEPGQTTYSQPRCQPGAEASRSARWLSLNKNGYCVALAAARKGAALPQKENEASAVWGAQAAATIYVWLL